MGACKKGRSSCSLRNNLKDSEVAWAGEVLARLVLAAGDNLWLIRTLQPMTPDQAVGLNYDHHHRFIPSWARFSDMVFFYDFVF